MDEPFNEKLNLDELYERTRETSQTKVKTYQKNSLRVFIHVLKPYLDSVTIINFVCLLYQNSY